MNFSSKQSFSLVEIIIAIAVFAIIISFTIPIIINEKQYLNNDLDKLYATFIYLQQKAIATNKKQTITFNEKENYYFIEKNNIKKRHNLSKQISFGFIEKVLGPPRKPNKKIEKTISFALNEVIFFCDGNISPGTVYLITKNKQLMGALTSSVSGVAMPKKYIYIGKKWVSL